MSLSFGRWPETDLYEWEWLKFFPVGRGTWFEPRAAFSEPFEVAWDSTQSLLAKKRKPKEQVRDQVSLEIRKRSYSTGFYILPLWSKS